MLESVRYCWVVSLDLYHSRVGLRDHWGGGEKDTRIRQGRDLASDGGVLLKVAHDLKVKMMLLVLLMLLDLVVKYVMLGLHGVLATFLVVVIVVLLFMQDCLNRQLVLRQEFVEIHVLQLEVVLEFIPKFWSHLFIQKVVKQSNFQRAIHYS